MKKSKNMEKCHKILKKLEKNPNMKEKVQNPETV